MSCTITVNGVEHRIEMDPMSRLVDVLRDRCGLTGTKEGCGEGECGACTVFLNGRLVNSCLVPLITADGGEVRTIEYVKETETGRVLTEAFAEFHGVQCGFCTPGMIVAAVDLLARIPRPREEEIRMAISGNLCRCTGYDMIVQAILAAAGRLEGNTEDDQW